MLGEPALDLGPCRPLPSFAMSKPKDGEDQGGWLMIGMDPKMARRQGLPQQIPVPKADFEGIADKGLNIDLARKWVKAFLTESPAGQDGTWRRRNSGLVTQLEGFIDNAALWEKAQKAFATDDYAGAITVLKRITIMNADDHAAKLNLASALANTGDYDGALKNFKAIRESFEGDPDYHVAVGHVYLRKQDKDNALNEMVLALEAKPDCQPALDALLQLGVLRAIYENPRDAASLTYVRTDAVVQYLGELWDAEARDAAFFLEQLAYHEREGRHDVALAAAERAVTASGDAGNERAELARVAALRALGRITESLAAIDAYIEKAPKSSGARVERAKSLGAAGSVDASLAAVEEALAIDPGDLAALMFRYWPSDQNDIKRIGDAVPELQKFVDAHPEAAGAKRTLARAYLATGRIDDAMELFQKALALTPTDDELRAEYWSELGRHQRYTEILADAEKITDMSSRDWKLRWNEAEAYAGLGKKIEARGAFSAINFDDRLHVDIRKRAKRAVKSIDEAPPEASGGTAG
ncbi:TPR domain protein [Minicystis rosea]|nr:TPR domain protein [Minicystis rosea]